jgi:hypothetical protein
LLLCERHVTPRYFRAVDPDQAGHSRRRVRPAAPVRMKELVLSIRTTPATEDRVDAGARKPPSREPVQIRAPLSIALGREAFARTGVIAAK